MMTKRAVRLARSEVETASVSKFKLICLSPIPAPWRVLTRSLPEVSRQDRFDRRRFDAERD